MSETKSTADWSQDWQAMQQQYWNAWSDATRQSVGQTPSAATPWHEGLEQWSRMFAGSGQQSETADRLMSSAKNYVALMQSMVATASGKNVGAGAGPTQLLGAPVAPQGPEAGHTVLSGSQDVVQPVADHHRVRGSLEQP